jgi:predicted RNA-binding Zn-ribbon protein involved in translation (DUF1610 family)
MAGDRDHAEERVRDDATFAHPNSCRADGAGKDHVAMTEDHRCPRCGKDLLVHGSLSLRGGFRPEELRFFSLSFQLPAVHVRSASAACTSCGLVWSELDAAALRQKLHDLGNEDVKQRLGLADGG